MIQVNLLPWRKQKQKRLLNKTIFFCLVVMTVSLTAIFTMKLKIDSGNQQHRQAIAEIRQQTEQLLVKITQINENQKQLDGLRQQQSQIDRLQQQSLKTVRILFLLTQWLPEQAWLKTITLNSQKIIIEGNALSYQAIVSFTNSIKDATEFEHVEVTHVAQVETAQSELVTHFNFKLEALWQS